MFAVWSQWLSHQAQYSQVLGSQLGTSFQPELDFNVSMDRCMTNSNMEGRKEGNVLFNDTLNTFYLWLYSVKHMVKDHSDSVRKPTAATWATLSD